jgi:hypothetical protein
MTHHLDDIERRIQPRQADGEVDELTEIFKDLGVRPAARHDS